MVDEMQGNTHYDGGGNIGFDYGFQIDERVQVALGHFIKDFEDGNISAECLGPKYGEYGSFLPMCERSPQSHPRTAQAQRHSKSPSNLRLEAAVHHSKTPSDMPPSMRLGTASHNAPPFHNLRAPLVDDSVKMDTRIFSNAEIKKCTLKDDCAIKSENFTDQRALKLRIKVKSDILSKENSAIYSGLGLDISPSSSMGNSPEESEVMPPVSKENPEESPTSIVRVMTSFTIPGGVLISPLHDSMLYLKKEKVHRESRPVSSLSAHQERCSVSTDESDSFAGDGNLLKKRMGMLDQSEKQYINSNFSKNDMTLHQKKIFGNRTPDGKDFLSTDLKSTPLSSSICDAGEAAEVTGTGFKISKKVNKDGVECRTVSIEAVKEDSLESISGQDFDKIGKQNTGNSFLKKVPEHKPEICQNNNASDLTNNGKYNALMISEKAESDQKGRAKSEGKNKSKGEWSPGKAMTATEKDSTGATINPMISDKNSAGIGVTGKNKMLKIKSLKDNKTRDYLKEKKPERKGGGIDRAPVNKAKINANLDSIEGKSTYRVKVKEKSSDNKVANQLLASPCVKDAPGAFPIAENKPIPEMVPPPPPTAPQLIEENWVGCDSCQQWRLLPMSVNPDKLPEKWLCSMLDWLPGMNQCSISEDETTNAVRALYQIPISEDQNNVQSNPTGPETGVSSADALQFDRNHKTSSSDRMSARGKNKQGINKEIVSGSSIDMHQLSNTAKNNAQESGKNKSLIDANQQPAGSNLLKKSSSKHSNGFKNLIEEKKIPKEKDEQMNGGDRNHVKLKRKIVADQSKFGTLKKSRAEGVHSADKQLNPDMDFEQVGLNSRSCLPAEASGKNMREHDEYCLSKGLHNKSVVLLKKGDQAQFSSDDGSLDVTNSSKNGSIKKRKSNDWLDNMKQNNTLSTQGDMLYGEESNVSGFRKEKKHRVLNPVEKSVAEGDAKLSRKGGTKQTFLSDSTDQMTVGTQLKNVDKAKQPRKLRKNVGSNQDFGLFDPSGKDLDSGQPPLAATSSSSKISGSCKARNNLAGMRGSPVESVTSSPLRTSILDRRILAAGSALEKVDSTKGAPSSMSSGRSSDMVGKLSVKMKGRNLCDLPTQHGNCGNGSHHEEKMSKIDQENASWQKPGKVTSLQVKVKNRKSGSEVRRDKMNISASENGFSKKGVNYESALTPSHCASGTETRNDANISSSDSRHKNVDNLSTKNSSWHWPNEAGKQTEPKQKDLENSVLKVGPQCGTSEKLISQQNLIHNFEEENKAIPVHTGSRDGKAKILSSTDNKAKRETSNVDSRTAPESQKGDMSNGHLMHNSVMSVDAQVHARNSADVSCKVGINRSSGNFTLDAQLREPSPVTTNSSQTAFGILEKARKLKDSADHYKNSGFEFESNETYFKAALKFLHGASLIENCPSESSKLGEMDQIQIYATTAKLFESCAYKYDRCQEMASAALAYKCMEVAYMRLVYCKHSSINRDRHELQSALQIVSQGESPSSSASDIDNLNNMVAVDKATLPRGPTHVANNQVISARNCPSIARLLDFTQDINFAMEASRKCQSTFMAAKLIMEEARSSDCMTSIRNVIDFSFQDVEEFVHLVLLATKAITRTGLGGARD